MIKVESIINRQCRSQQQKITCLAFRDGWIPPTLNLEERGEGCDLDYVVGEGRSVDLRWALSNSFGFGGINAALVLGAPRTSAVPEDSSGG